MRHYDHRRSISLLREGGDEFQMFQDTLFTEPKMSAAKQEEYRFYNW